MLESINMPLWARATDMLFNSTFNNISVISWRSVLLVEETRVPGEHHRSAIMQIWLIKVTLYPQKRGGRGRDRMVVGFTTTYEISVYHHWCEFESRSGRGVQHYVIKFVSDLRQVGGFPRTLRFPPPIKKWPPRYNWNIVESSAKHHQIYKQRKQTLNNMCSDDFFG
jgi:hypothetical protein